MPTIIRDDQHAPDGDRNDAEPRLRALLDAAVDAIITIDRRGVIESVNPATERLFGYHAVELLGCNVSMLAPPPHRAQHDGYIQRYLMTGEQRIIGIGREVEARRKDGTLFPVDLSVTEFELDGEVMFMGLVRDISDRRAAERAAQARLDELAHAGRLADLGLTTSAIAHEVNQPLTAIVSFAHACQRMLKSEQPDEEVLRDALAQIAEQGERASAIISRIRSMARRGERTRELVNLNETVGTVMGILARPLKYQKVSVALELADPAPQVQADRVQVEQIVMNLANNALEAMQGIAPGGRHLWITTTLSRKMATLSITDSGPGLQPDQLEQVFDNFFTTKPQGLGVGLSICRSLAEAHGGRLWAESTPGRGATFHLGLPSSP